MNMLKTEPGGFTADTYASEDDVYAGNWQVCWRLIICRPTFLDASPRLGSAAAEPPPPNSKKENAVLPLEAEVFHFDLKVFAASLTVMRSGESVRTAGI